MNNCSSHFKCFAGIDEVIITPDYNVYPCIYLAKPGYEIGKYIDGKIMLFDKFNNNGDKCIVQQVFNNNDVDTFTKKLTKEVE